MSTIRSTTSPNGHNKKNHEEYLCSGQGNARVSNDGITLVNERRTVVPMLPPHPPMLRPMIEQKNTNVSLSREKIQDQRFIPMCPFIVEAGDIGSDNGEKESRGIPITTRAEAYLAKNPKLHFVVRSFIESARAGKDSEATNRLRTLLDVPTRLKIPELKEYCTYKEELDKKIAGHDNAKDILVTQLISSIKTKTNRFVHVLVGNPGIGKSRLLNTIGDLFGRPVIFIYMDTAGDAGSIVGRDLGFKGEGVGQLLSGLINAKYLNPIIVLEELDKVIEGSWGDEILNLCNVLLDEERPRFTSKYLSLDIDMSHVGFIISVNDLTRLRRKQSLYNRLKPVIYMSDYSSEQQKDILVSSILPELCKKYSVDVVFPPETIDVFMEYLKKNNEDDEENHGLRTLKRLADNVLCFAIAKNLALVSPHEATLCLSRFQKP